ncbi:MAG: hypothetical protein VZQ97_05415, partial [Candidatus Onthomonas sp.]|nr:hypothetical protein [Candidatus Onthomonas sp.]
RDDLAVRRIINEPKRGIGQTTINKLSDYAAENNLSFLEAVEICDRVGGLSGGTIAKLREFMALIDGVRGQLAGFSVKELIAQQQEILGRNGVKQKLADDLEANKRHLATYKAQLKEITEAVKLTGDELSQAISDLYYQGYNTAKVTQVYRLTVKVTFEAGTNRLTVQMKDLYAVKCNGKWSFCMDADFLVNTFSIY